MADELSESSGTFSSFTTYFINIPLIGIIFYLLWKIFKTRNEVDKPVTYVSPAAPPMKKRDFTLEELKEFDGTKGEGRVLVAVNNKVFDVSRGKRYYGPGGPYAVFAGRDASRGLATFSLDVPTDKYDDLSDLQPSEMESVLEWEMQFNEKYDYVGKLLKPGETHNSYSDDEGEGNQKEDEPNPKEEDITSKSKDD